MEHNPSAGTFVPQCGLARKLRKLLSFPIIPSAIGKSSQDMVDVSIAVGFTESNERVVRETVGEILRHKSLSFIFLYDLLI